MFGSPGNRIPTLELVLLLGFMMTLGAVTQDIMLPALRLIDDDLGLGGSNSAQYVITASLLGLGLGQLFYGPLSDSVGRRKALFLGLGIYMLGSLICFFSQGFTTLLLGRALQGLGAASPRVLSTSIARDLYEGKEMARIVSYIIAIQMTTPVIAPALGQFVSTTFDWRAIFLLVLALAATVCVWFGLRQPETLPLERRRRFSLRSVTSGYLEVMRSRQSVWYAVALGISMGSVIGFIMSSPQMFADIYGVTTLFPVYFGGLCLALGLGSVLSARLVLLVGTRRICLVTLMMIIFLSLIGLYTASGSGGSLVFSGFLTWSALSFVFSGALFGNLNAIAMRPLGHIAGVGAAFVGALSTMIYASVATAVGQVYDGTLIPVIFSFLVSGTLTFFILLKVNE